MVIDDTREKEIEVALLDGKLLIESDSGTKEIFGHTVA
jgi:hypothetical protein